MLCSFRGFAAKIAAYFIRLLKKPIAYIKKFTGQKKSYKVEEKTHKQAKKSYKVEKAKNGLIVLKYSTL